MFCTLVVLPVIAVVTYFDTRDSTMFAGWGFALVFGFYWTALIWVVGLLGLGLYALVVHAGRRADRRAHGPL
jgi:hypothetical protein